MDADERFEVAAARHLGMVVFRLKGENDQTEKLLKKLNGSGNEMLSLGITFASLMFRCSTKHNATFNQVDVALERN